MFLQIIGAALSLLITFGWLIIPNSPQLVGKSVRNIKTKEKVVALTFDDGPNPPYTNQILNILDKHNVKATFFMAGKHIKQSPQTIKVVYMSGHEIGNHSWHHKVLVGKSSKFIREEINSTDKLIRDLGYTGTIHFRSPKGMKFVALPKILKQQNRPNILFDVVAWDWTNPGTEKIVKNVIKNVKPGSIILLHDGNGDVDFIGNNRSQTVAATDIIIQKLKNKDYRFLTISELLKIPKS